MCVVVVFSLKNKIDNNLPIRKVVVAGSVGTLLAELVFAFTGCIVWASANGGRKGFTGHHAFQMLAVTVLVESGKQNSGLNTSQVTIAIISLSLCMYVHIHF